MRAPRAAALALAAALLASGCRPDDQRTETVDPRARAEIPAPVLAQLDSGSAAFRADHFGGAEAHYRRATELDPGIAAGWFGRYMVAQRMGQADSAAAYLERAQQIAPGASLIHPTPADTAP